MLTLSRLLILTAALLPWLLCVRAWCQARGWRAEMELQRNEAYRAKRMQERAERMQERAERDRDRAVRLLTEDELLRFRVESMTEFCLQLGTGERKEVKR